MRAWVLSDKGRPKIPSMANKTRCPPSRAGSGRRFIRKRDILRNAKKLMKFLAPASAASPACCAIPTGPEIPEDPLCPESMDEIAFKVSVDIFKQR